MLLDFGWLIFSYLLGSLPFGYLISRREGKNILKIGWRKTSGSNVFRNVGKFAGILTGISDLLKGFFAVWGAQKLGLPQWTQIFSGVAVVSGHNWSLFLKFAGGRGIGTFIGAFFALSPKIIFISVVPFAIIAAIWDAAIGTLVFLAVAIFLSFVELETLGFFPLISLIPILAKRLSPIKELKNVANKKRLFFNRLIFDNEQGYLGLRIEKLFRKISEKSEKIVKVIKFLLMPVIVTHKIGTEVVKKGVEVIKKPLQKLLETPEVVVTQLTAEDLKNMMIVSAKKIVLHQEEINKINVWPVADKDTGYNLAATLLGIEGVIGYKKYASIRELAKDIKEGAMANARGNAGMIYTGFLIKFLDKIKHLDFVEATDFARALQKGFGGAHQATVEPVEGTILDVIKAAGEKAYEVAKFKNEKNIIKVLEEAGEVAQTALEETTGKLEALKKANVVDAGGLGFVKILEAWIESLKGPSPELKTEESQVIAPKAEEKSAFRYELVFSFKKPEISAEDKIAKLKEEISGLGNSLDVLESDSEIKIHIHTNLLEKIKEAAKDFEITEWKAEDLQDVKESVARKPLGLVVGETANLPQDFIKKYQIEEVPFKSRFPDGEILTKENFFQKLREAMKTGRPLPTTSAPSFGDFLSAYQKALEKFEKILVITLSSKLSGTYSSARIARSIYKKPEKLNITVFDCASAEVGEGLVAIKAQELIDQGKNIEDILEELKTFCPKIIFLGFIEDIKHIARSGRIHLPGFIVKIFSYIQKIGLRILIEIKNGKVRFSSMRFSRDPIKVLVKEIIKRSQGKKIRVAIAHAERLKEAQELQKQLEKNLNAEIMYVSSVSAVVGTYTGPGTMLVAFYVLN